MKEEIELKLLAYADGELPAAEIAEIESLLIESPAAADLLAELRWSHSAILEADSDLKVPENREFYWSKVSRSIEAAERNAEQGTTRAPVVSWWRQAFAPLAGLAAVALVLSINLDQPATEGQEGVAAPLTVVAPEPVWEDASVYEFYDEKEKMSVIWVTTDGSVELASPTRENLFRDDEF